MMQILPSVLSTTEQDYQHKIEKIEESEAFEGGWLHVDFADNEFVPNLTVGIEALKKYPTNLRMEAHLMVAKPEEWTQELIEAGTERLIIHIETLENPKLLEEIKKQKIEIGLAIKLETPVAKLVPFVGTIDVILVMSIHPGFSGQEFLPEGLDKIREVAALRSEHNADFKIEVDGGVSADNIRSLADAGVDGVIMASHLIEGDIDENLEKIWETFKG